MTDEKSIKQAFTKGEFYKVETICARLKDESKEYTDRLTRRKLELVLAHYRPGLTIDFCCATGGHLFDLKDHIDEGLGIDFSQPFIEKANRDAHALPDNRLHFIVADGTKLPLPTGCARNLYSFSSLYLFKDVSSVLAEIARVLGVGGIAVLDVCNKRSLNAYCVARLTGYPPSYFFKIEETIRMLNQSGFKVVEHRAFQLLPLWTDRPRWLWPLLHPIWKPIMACRIGGRMIDEWLSNLPGLKRVAFRHMIVCEKLP